MTKQQNILPSYYEIFIRNICSQLECNIWLTGGWLLSHRLFRNYAGDIDLLVDIDEDLLIDRCKDMGLVGKRTYSGAIRVCLPDNNHIDFWADPDFSSKNKIREHLARFNWSCVSSALNLDSSELIETNSCSEDLSNRTFRFNKGYALSFEDTVSNLKFADKLIRFYGFKPADDDTKSTINAQEKSYRLYMGAPSTPKTMLNNAIKRLCNVLPSNNDYYICRGFVRNLVLEKFSYWDDIDVIVQLTPEEVKDHLNAKRIQYTDNYFNMPKLRLDIGQKVDVICVGDTAITDTLSLFAHNVDRIAWDPTNNQYIDIEGSLSDIKDNRLTIMEGLPEDNLSTSDWNYYAIKSAFLIAKDAYTVSDQLRSHIGIAREFSDFDRSNAVRLARELCSRVPSSRLTELLQVWKKCDRDSAAFLLSYYIQDVIR